ncbi:uncharacterized protein [Bombus fervidus]|uniref:uncharacterized protein n=1 Tax=Bombus fervidus TaxID=203811 RepID=UPI003AB7AAA5
MVPKALYILLIACIFGTIIQMSLAASSESSNKTDSSKSSDSSDSSNSSNSSNSSEEPAEQKTQKPPTKQEEAENKVVMKKLEIVLPTIPAISPISGLKPNVEKAKEMVARRLNSESNFINAVADSIRLAVHAAKPILAIGNLIAKIISVFTDVASSNPVKLGVLILQEGIKIGMGVLSVSLPLLISGVIAVAS